MLALRLAEFQRLRYARKSVAGDCDVASSLQRDAAGELVVEFAFDRAFADVAVAKAVAGDGDAAAVFGDAQAACVERRRLRAVLRFGWQLQQHERVGRDRAAVCVHQINAAAVVSDYVRRQRDAVAVASQHDRSAVAFLDHVARDDRAVSVLDHHAVAEVIVHAIAGEAEVAEHHMPQLVVRFDLLAVELLGTVSSFVGEPWGVAAACRSG